MAERPLVQGPGIPANLLLKRGTRPRPREGIDISYDVRVRDGEIAELGSSGTLEKNGDEEAIEASGRTLLPAFFDPHVHLRTPGQEHKEDLETGTRAAAAGGFGAVIAMPNTDPVLDSAPLLRSLRDAAAREARIPVGFLGAITRGLKGEELTEMAELREVGALGFTMTANRAERRDAEKGPAIPAPVRRRAHFARGGQDALARGVMHEGAISAALGLGGYRA